MGCAKNLHFACRLSFVTVLCLIVTAQISHRLRPYSGVSRLRAVTALYPPQHFAKPQGTRPQWRRRNARRRKPSSAACSGTSGELLDSNNFVDAVIISPKRRRPPPKPEGPAMSDTLRLRRNLHIGKSKKYAGGSRRRRPFARSQKIGPCPPFRPGRAAAICKCLFTRCL
jgi:hypothetical protein